MSGAVGQFAVDTLVYTGLLIVLVLALRGAVARWFGPQVAYALWALPLLRLFMPPLTLPASMAPAPALVPAELVAAEVPALAPAVIPPPADFPIAEVLTSIWLLGAAAFLIWRVRQYLAMRRCYLAEARPVGEVGRRGRGRVRLVETPAADLPLAFGIFDKVVALPPLFMAHPDRAARDLAIAHELAHHRGNDLAANLAAQLLLALHWFNPVAWIGWKAMRKDQEAACDARVVFGRERSERIAYAEVIAGFAAGNRLSLPAPLACPVASFGLGEKSIIHRLRTLASCEIPAQRRRIGVGAVALGALALPFTASISYAHPDPESAPSGPDVERRMVIVDVPNGLESGAPLHEQQVEREDGTIVTLRTAEPLTPEQAEDRIETAIANIPQPPLPPQAPLAPLPPEAPVPPAAGQTQARQVGAPQAGSQVTRYSMAISDGSRDGRNVAVMTSCDDADGEACRAHVEAIARAAESAVDAQAIAVEALSSARAAIARAPMPEYARTEALREIDREIAELREGAKMSAVGPEIGLPEALGPFASKAAFLRITFAPSPVRAAVAVSEGDCGDEYGAPGRIA